ncbi:hypothetical protein [Sphingobium sp. Ant17]|uniref:hypothetical protein n=1 Tax=Sphingobium sp. Ant17 TaxID=1461752 RepID=UPI000452DF74|nr:hypothetical protein [Sphingobium sp. Ant17]EXS67968.1 hypothetical protein BF95_12150 [Sphingobium sp. Ant17]
MHRPDGANGTHGWAARTEGRALPKLKTLLANPATRWTSILVSAWYGHLNGKTLQITSDIALWYRPGTPVLPVRWVLVRDPDGKRDPQAFFSTDITLEPADIIALSSADGKSKSPLPKPALTWVSRHSASGPTKP